MRKAKDSYFISFDRNAKRQIYKNYTDKSRLAIEEYKNISYRYTTSSISQQVAYWGKTLFVNSASPSKSQRYESADPLSYHVPITHKS